MRVAKARTHEELEQVLVAALEPVTSIDCLNGFKPFGYQLTPGRN
jgi:hypothetical protein